MAEIWNIQLRNLKFIIYLMRKYNRSGLMTSEYKGGILKILSCTTEFHFNQLDNIP